MFAAIIDPRLYPGGTLFAAGWFDVTLMPMAWFDRWVGAVNIGILAATETERDYVYYGPAFQ